MKFLPLFLLPLASQVFAQEAAAEDDDEDLDEVSKVVVLNNDNFESTLSSNKYVLVKFYAPWCGHCKQMAPEFDKAASELEGKVVLAKLDATEFQDLGQKYEVQGYPTLYWFDNGEKVEYTGGRTKDTIVEWVNTVMSDPVTTVTELPEIKEKPQMVLYAPTITEEFEAFAKVNRFKASMLFKNSPENKISIQHKGEEVVTLNETKNKEAIENFFKENQMPLWGILSGETYGNYMETGKGLVWGLFSMETSEELSKVGEENRAMMIEVARKFKGKYFVTYTDTVQFKSALEGMLGVTTFPTIAVNKKAGDKMKYLYTGAMTAPDIIEFIEGVENGTISPSLKSEAIPEKQDAVRVVVGKSMEDELFSPEKDILFEIYAPWCGHCKKLAPEYEKVAKKVEKENLGDLITLSKMDGSANDSPIEEITWEGFPTLYYFKAGDKTPIKYDGPRDAKGIWKWIKQNHSKSDMIKERIEANKSASTSEKDEL